MCRSCHNRMDPIGLAFENFNAIGGWRDTERKQPIVAEGNLITGETFKSVAELKKILANDHREEFYRTLTTKLMTYATGRGMEYYDVETIDQIVKRLQGQDGKFGAMLAGIIDSAPFQKMRTTATVTAAELIPRGQADMSNDSKKSPQQLAAERHESFSRRRFLAAAGVTIALPALASLAPRSAFAASQERQGAHANGLCLRAEWRHPRGLVACRRRRFGFRALAHARTARQGAEPPAGHRRSRRPLRQPRSRWRG